MSRMHRERRSLQIVRGGRGDLFLGDLRVSLTDTHLSHVASEAVVMEDDTWQVLAAPAEFREEREHPVRLLRALHNARPLVPGSVLVRGGTPVTFVAAIYDLGEEPVCRPEWITTALTGILSRIGEMRLNSLALPLTGVRHGRIAINEAVVIIATALRECSPPCLKRLWLVVRPEDHAAVRESWPTPVRSHADDGT